MAVGVGVGVAVCGEAAVVGAGVFFFHLVDLAHQPDLPDNGCDQEDDHEDKRSDRVESAADADTEQADEAQLGDVDACGELEEGASVRSTVGGDISAQCEESTVPERKVEKNEADSSESEDQWSDRRVGKS